MKMSLRNFALAGALALAGVAMAQEAPFTVTENWFHQINEPYANDIRFGTGVDGKVYLANKNAAVAGIQVYDATGQLETIPATVAVNVTSDDAGNLLWHGSWPSGTANGTTYYIRNAQTGEITTFQLERPSGVTNSRTDFFGRVVGDLLSEEGAMFYICSNTDTQVSMVFIKEGQQVECPFEYDGATGPYAFDSTTIAQPRFSYEEIMDMSDDDAPVACAVRKRGAPGCVPSICEDYEWHAIGSVAGAKTSEGFDVFYINDTEYFVVPCGDVNYTSRFAVVDAEGTIYYQSPADHEVSAAAGQGFGAITARVVSDTKVEIYVGGHTNATPNLTYAGLYTLNFGDDEPAVEEPLYTALAERGIYAEWGNKTVLEGAKDINVDVYEDHIIVKAWAGVEGYDLKVVYDNEDYSVISVANIINGVEGEAVATPADEDEFAYAYLYTGKTAEDYIAVALQTGFNYAATWEGDMGYLIFTAYKGEETGYIFLYWPQLPSLYVYGEFQNWDPENPAEMEVLSGTYYTFTFPEGTSEFKMSWAKGSQEAIDAEALTVSEVIADNHGQTYYDIVEGTDNTKFGYADGQWTIQIYIDEEVAKINAFNETDYVPAPARAAYAYGIKVEKDEITYSLNADATAVNALLTNTETQEVTTYPLAGTKQGTYTEKIDGMGGKFTVEIEVVSEVEGEGDAIEVYAAPEHQPSTVRGGIAIIRDTEEDAFGMTVVSHGKRGGFDVYDQTGKFLGKYHQNYDKLSSTNQSSAFRGDALHGKAYFADWSDMAAGEWVIDPLNPETEPYNYLMSEGAEMAASGLVTLNGVGIGGGTSTVAFSKEQSGDNLKMYTFEEDLASSAGTKNYIAVYNIGDGTAKNLTAGPVADLPWSVSLMANTNVDIEDASKGYFASQVRANYNDVTPAWVYINDDNKRVCIARDIQLCEDTDGCSSGIALNYDETLFAIANYHKITICAFEWTEVYDELEDADITMPALTKIAEIPVAGMTWSQIEFDRANNLHVYAREVGGYHVFALTGGNTSVTPAKAGQYLELVQNGVESISLEAAAAADAIYYNLQGQRVAADNLTTGIYVKLQGKVASKVIVK